MTSGKRETIKTNVCTEFACGSCPALRTQSGRLDINPSITIAVRMGVRSKPQYARSTPEKWRSLVNLLMDFWLAENHKSDVRGNWDSRIDGCVQKRNSKTPNDDHVTPEAKIKDFRNMKFE
jgi:hypothetical protein